LIPNLEEFREIYCLKGSLSVHSISDPSIAMFCPGKYLKLCIDMGQDWIHFEKFIWSLVCSYIIVVVEMHTIAD
jgi:hypothetical protein